MVIRQAYQILLIFEYAEGLPPETAEEAGRVEIACMREGIVIHAESVKPRDRSARGYP